MLITGFLKMEIIDSKNIEKDNIVIRILNELRELTKPKNK